MSLARLHDSLLLTLRWSAIETVPRAAPIHTVVPPSVFDLVSELGVGWVTLASARGADPVAPLRARGLPPAGSLVEAQCGESCDQENWDDLRRALSGLGCAAVGGAAAWDVASCSAPWLPPSAPSGSRRDVGNSDLRRAAFPVDEACIENFGRLLDLVPCGPGEGAKDLFFRARRLPLSYYGFHFSAFVPAGEATTGERAAGFDLTLYLQVHRQHEAALVSALSSRNMTGCGTANRTTVVASPHGRVGRVSPSSSLALEPVLVGEPSEPMAAPTAAMGPEDPPLSAWRSVEELEGPRARLHYRLALATTAAGTGANVTVEDRLPWYVRPAASSIRVEGPLRGGAPKPSVRLAPGWSRTAPSELTVTAYLVPGDGLAVTIEVGDHSAHTLRRVLGRPRWPAHRRPPTPQLDKEFLTVDEFPPDASRGLDLPPAAVLVHQSGCRERPCAGDRCSRPACHGAARATLFLPGAHSMQLGKPSRGCRRRRARRPRAQPSWS